MLTRFPDGAACFAYEGEETGIVIRDGRKQLGVILCKSGERIDTDVLIREDDGREYYYEDSEVPHVTPPARTEAPR